MSLRDYKLSYRLYNFFQKAKLKHYVPLYRDLGLKKKYYSNVSSEDFRGMVSPPNRYDASNSKIEMPRQSDFNRLDKETQEALLGWSDNGYAILKSFISEDEVDSYNAEIDHLVESGAVQYRYTNKIMFAINHSDLLKGVATNPRMINILNVILGKQVELFQSINFLKGSQQRTHSDSIHMTTFPFGNMIAVWIALEDVDETSGPLHYYPGSHKLPYVLNRDYNNIGSKHKLGKKNYEDYEDHIEKLVSTAGIPKEIFKAKKGDILIWHANLLHGGEMVKDATKSRKSMVLHFYADDVICFHEVSQRPALRHSY